MSSPHHKHLFCLGLEQMMLDTGAEAVRFAIYGNITGSPAPENTSVAPTWPSGSETNITKPHRCLQVLYEDIGNSR